MFRCYENFTLENSTPKNYNLGNFYPRKFHSYKKNKLSSYFKGSIKENAPARTKLGALIHLGKSWGFSCNWEKIKEVTSSTG